MSGRTLGPERRDWGEVGWQGGLAIVPKRTLRGCLTRGEAFHLALAGLTLRRQAEGGHCGRSR